MCALIPCSFFFFNDTATTEIYTLSLHDALPICTDRAGLDPGGAAGPGRDHGGCRGAAGLHAHHGHRHARSEEHTSELQSLTNLVCRLLLEKKKNQVTTDSGTGGIAYRYAFIRRH